MWIFCPQMTLHDVPIHMWVFCPQMTLHHIPGVSGTFMFITWYLWVMTSRDKTKWPIVRATNVVSSKHKVKKLYWCMTSSEPKNCLWIFCPQMTLHDIPKIPQIGVKPMIRIYTYLSRLQKFRHVDIDISSAPWNWRPLKIGAENGFCT